MAARRRSTRRGRGARGSGRGRRGGGGSRAFALLLGLGALIALAVAIAPSRAVRPLRSWWSERQGIARVESHAETILFAARESRVDPNLLAGIMMVESRGHVDARSPVGALGLFQLMPPTAAEQAAGLGLGRPSERELLSDARLNARLGARYIAWLMRRYEGDVERALVAYNAGPGRLQRWIGEAGSYAAWRDARERAGDSKVLAYARDVLAYRACFAERGEIAPTAREGPPGEARPNPTPARLPLPLSTTVDPAAPEWDPNPTAEPASDPNSLPESAPPQPAPIGPPREPPDASPADL